MSAPKSVAEPGSSSSALVRNTANNAISQEPSSSASNPSNKPGDAELAQVRERVQDLLGELDAAAAQGKQMEAPAKAVKTSSFPLVTPEVLKPLPPSNPALLELVKNGDDVVVDDEQEEEDGELSDWSADAERVKDVFSEAEFESPRALLEAIKSEHGIDFSSLASVDSQGLPVPFDQLMFARAVNFARARSAAGDSVESISRTLHSTTETSWRTSEQYLHPFLQNDPLLWWDPTDSDDEDDEEEVARALASVRVAQPIPAEQDSSATEEEEAPRSAAVAVENDPEADSGYFHSYAHLDIHETMLRDTARTEAYMNAIRAESALLGATVLDVGCGTGVLSMFAAKAGAKKVYAVEASGIADQAEKLIRANNCQDAIELLRGRVEKLVETKSLYVDAIVSEWMGYGLFYESMFESVLCARDAWLKPGGRMYPSRATLDIFAVFDAEARISYWDDVYGLDFSLMKPLRTRDADVALVAPSSLRSAKHRLRDFDLEKITALELDFETPFRIVCNQTEDALRIDGICISFDVDFPHGPILTTSPEALATHWKQTTLWLDDPLHFPAAAGAAADASREITGKIAFKRRYRENHRELDILLTLESPETRPVRAYPLR